MGSSVKKTYTPKFKVKVVKYAKTQKNIAEASRRFEVDYNTVRRWINNYESTSELEDLK